MRICLTLILLIFSNCINLLAQSNESNSKILKSGNEINLHSLPYYNFGKGVGITSPDSLFQFNIRFRMQNRLEVSESENGDKIIDAYIRRLRLRFDGYVGNPDFLYVIQLSFSPDDVGEIQSGSNLNIIRDAIFFYQPNNQWGIGFGQTKLPGNRQRVNSSGALQLTDRSINNARFNIDRDFGVQSYYLSRLDHNFQFNLRGAISTGEGRNWTKAKNTGLAYTGRLELFPLGRFQKSGEFFEGDIKREQTPKVLIGGIYHFNNDAMRIQGEQGKLLYQTRDLTSNFIDIMGKYKGLALMYAYMSRQTDNPITRSTTDTSLFNYAIVGQGHDFQSSYLFKSNWEIIGRYSTFHPDSKIFQYIPDQQQYTIGLTRYIWEHAFKIQTELTYNNFNYFNNSKTNSWYWRFQIELGI